MLSCFLSRYNYNEVDFARFALLAATFVFIGDLIALAGAYLALRQSEYNQTESDKLQQEKGKPY